MGDYERLYALEKKLQESMSCVTMCALNRLKSLPIYFILDFSMLQLFKSIQGLL